MASTAIEPTARNSDCQFCSVASQKSEEPRYCSQESGSCSCSSCSALYSLQPVTDWASHDQSQIVAMTRTSELEYTQSRQPPALAQRGESGLACLPSICCSSLSPPSSPGCLDSVEPFWMNQTVSRMKSVNWRYSDCQFSDGLGEGRR